MSGSTYRSALLLGSSHPELGAIAIEKIAPGLAIGISRGRFPKGYPHVDPNEDAVFAATDGSTSILAVADGHHGFDAARAAITAIAGAAAAATGASAESTARLLAVTAIDSVRATVPSLPAPRNTSRTALTVAVIHGDSIAALTIGDTACFVATRRSADRVGVPTEFLSPDTDPSAIAVVTVPLIRGNAAVVASDGLLDFVPDARSLLRSASTAQASDAVGYLFDAAFAGGAGDNVAVAVAHRS